MDTDAKANDTSIPMTSTQLQTIGSSKNAVDQQWAFNRLPLNDLQFRDLVYGLQAEHDIKLGKAVDMAHESRRIALDDDMVQTPPVAKRKRVADSMDM